MNYFGRGLRDIFLSQNWIHNCITTICKKIYLDIIRVAGELLSAEELCDLLAEGVGVVLPPVELGRSEGGVAEGDDVVEEEAVRHLGVAHGLDALGGSEDGAALKMGFVVYLT